MKRRSNETEEIAVVGRGDNEGEERNAGETNDPAAIEHEVIYKKHELNDQSAEKIVSQTFAETGSAIATTTTATPSSIEQTGNKPNGVGSSQGSPKKESTEIVEEIVGNSLEALDQVEDQIIQSEAADVAAAAAAAGNDDDAEEQEATNEKSEDQQKKEQEQSSSVAAGTKEGGKTESAASIGSSESIRTSGKHSKEEGGAPATTTTTSTKGVKEIHPASKLTPQQIDDLKLQYLNARDLKKLVELCSPLADIYKEYTQLKYKNKIYQINNLVLIQNADDMQNDFIGKLTKIIRIENQGKFITLIQIRWFYKKDDLPKKKFENMLDCISDNEIFETDHLDITFVDCINGPCRLYNYNEFDKLGSVSQNSYYTRAKFDTLKKKLDPPFEKWEGGCICNRPLNPDYLYIQCEKCEKWFHISCVNIKEKDIDKIENYKCPPCVSSVNTIPAASSKLSIKDLQVVTQDQAKEVMAATAANAANAANAATAATTAGNKRASNSTSGTKPPAPALEPKRTRHQSHAAAAQQQQSQSNPATDSTKG